MENCSPFSVAFNSEASNAGSPELVLKLAVPENWPVLLGRHVTIRSMDCWGSTDTSTKGPAKGAATGLNFTLAVPLP